MNEASKWVAIIITILGTLVTGSMRFSAIETRVATMEKTQADVSSKLDRISDAVARIEGKLEK